MNKKRWIFILGLAVNLFCIVVWVLTTRRWYLKYGFELLTVLSGISVLAWIGRTVYDIRKYSAEYKEWKNQTKGE
ncbi:MAG: hypothetical protein IKI64_10570 [Clostridia bacterium]|nr:hypothetical protein [Clostridia bacterium]